MWLKTGRDTQPSHGLGSGASWAPTASAAWMAGAARGLQLLPCRHASARASEGEIKRSPFCLGSNAGPGVGGLRARRRFSCPATDYVGRSRGRAGYVFRAWIGLTRPGRLRPSRARVFSIPLPRRRRRECIASAPGWVGGRRRRICLAPHGHCNSNISTGRYASAESRFFPPRGEARYCRGRWICTSCGSASNRSSIVLPGGLGQRAGALFFRPFHGAPPNWEMNGQNHLHPAGPSGISVA